MLNDEGHVGLLEAKRALRPGATRGFRLYAMWRPRWQGSLALNHAPRGV